VFDYYDGMRRDDLDQPWKVENLRRVQAAEPDRTALYTWNAEVNRHMIAVNEALGFRPVGRLGEFVKQL